MNLPLKYSIFNFFLYGILFYSKSLPYKTASYTHIHIFFVLPLRGHFLHTSPARILISFFLFVHPWPTAQRSEWPKKDFGFFYFSLHLNTHMYSKRKSFLNADHFNEFISILEMLVGGLNFNGWGGGVNFLA